MKKSLLAVALTLCAFGNLAYAAEGQIINKSIDMQMTAAAEEHFSGRAYVKSLSSPNATTKVYSASVQFTPGARTNWHIHSKGQTLIVTDGIGYTQEWGKPITVLQTGDVVYCPPGVKHWHGATSNNSMTHIAVSEASDKGVTWLEPVSDAQYSF